MTPTILLRLILLGEAGFYALTARALLGAGWPAAAVVSAVAAMALSGRALIVATTYVFAASFRVAPPPGQRAGIFALLRMALVEYAAFIAVFTLVSPVERLFLGADRLGKMPAGRLPVLLVHGYQCNRGFWFWQRRRLERAGWTVATLDLGPVFASIDAYGEAIRARIEAICAVTGADRVVLVGHSMGGLAARAYLRAHGAARVAKLVTLGTPHHGSRLALLGVGPNARQMEPESAWLAALNATAAGPLPPSVSARSVYDNYVMPQDSPVLAGARDVLLGPVGHLTMAWSAAVTRLLLEELATA